jgi:hypothetical protein
MSQWKQAPLYNLVGSNFQPIALGLKSRANASNLNLKLGSFVPRIE